MAKRKRSQTQRDIRQLESDREWLVKTTIIGVGYVKAAIEKAEEAGDRTALATYLRHKIEMDLALDGSRPAAEDVLQRLGAEVARLKEEAVSE